MEYILIIPLVVYGFWATISCFDFIEDIKFLKQQNKKLKAELAKTKIKCNHERVRTVVLKSAVTAEEIGVHCHDCNTLLIKNTET